MERPRHSFDSFALQIRAHAWWTGYLIEFELLAGEGGAFKIEVERAAAYLRESASYEDTK